VDSERALAATKEETAIDWGSFPEDGLQQFKLLLLALFPMKHPFGTGDERIWIGDRHETGHLEYKRDFKALPQWLDVSYHPGPLVCPALFKPVERNGMPVWRRSLKPCEASDGNCLLFRAG